MALGTIVHDINKNNKHNEDAMYRLPIQLYNLMVNLKCRLDETRMVSIHVGILAWMGDRELSSNRLALSRQPSSVMCGSETDVVLCCNHLVAIDLSFKHAIVPHMRVGRHARPQSLCIGGGI